MKIQSKDYRVQEGDEVELFRPVSRLAVTSRTAIAGSAARFSSR